MCELRKVVQVSPCIPSSSIVDAVMDQRWWFQWAQSSSCNRSCTSEYNSLFSVMTITAVHTTRAALRRPANMSEVRSHGQPSNRIGGRGYGGR